MGTQTKWDAMLPDEADWDALLPNYDWKRYAGSNWGHIVPPPRPQLLGVLNRRFDGLCALHSFSETATAWLRIHYETNEVAVDLPRLLHLAAAKGFLTPDGSTFDMIRDFTHKYGIPLEGEMPAEVKKQKSCRLEDQHAEAFATNLTVTNFRTMPMPFGKHARTAQAAISYRESLCKFLNLGPVVLCYDIDSRYFELREPREPYCAQRWSWFVRTPTVGHCVTAYGYECPGGDVRTLRINYQENAVGAPSDVPGRLLIHPDAVHSFHSVGTSRVLITNQPAEGFRLVRQPTPPRKTLWEKTMSLF